MSDLRKSYNYYVTKASDEFRTNPWIQDLSMTIVKGNQITAMGKSKRVIDATTGEVLDTEIAMVSKKVVDKEEFVKLFEGGISNIFELSKTAQDMFRAVLSIYLDSKMLADRVYVSEMTLKDVGYERSKATRTNALNQLLNKGFIARVKGELNWYWVNPNMFYKGNRITLVEQYAIAGTSEGDEMKLEIEQQNENAKQQNLQLGE